MKYNTMPVFFTSLKKYAVGMTVVFFLVAVTVAVIVQLRSPMFQAGARINIPEIKKGESTPPPNSPAHQDVTLQTAVEILQGNVLAEQVMTTLGITKIFPHLEQDIQDEEDLLSRALAAFQQQLTVAPIKETRIIKITFQHLDAAISAQAVETLLGVFQKEFKKFHSPQEVLQNEQLLLLGQKMHQTARALSMFQLKNQLLINEDRDKITAQYDTLRKLLSTEQEAQEKQMTQLNRSKEQFANALKPDTQDSEQEKKQVKEGRLDLIRLKLYEQDLKGKYGEGSTGDQLIANVRLQITSLQKLLYTQAGVPKKGQKELEDTAEHIVFATIAYRNKQKKTDLLQRQVRQLKNKLQRVAEQDGLHAELRQQAETARQHYTSFVKQFETEQKIRERFGRILIIEKPVKPLAPIKPQKKPAFLLALTCGFIGSLLYGMIRMLRKGATAP
ncbi:MAG: hypothetical protein D3925_13465 [Candidatus Electrothrix sp. AR5]|nr:hypothetical protein [Candidatus Electrothrix sp. AR5]